MKSEKIYYPDDTFQERINGKEVIYRHEGINLIEREPKINVLGVKKGDVYLNSNGIHTMEVIPTTNDDKYKEKIKKKI